MPAVWEENLDGLDAVEAHWGTGTILTIFFATTLVSALFFGLGYSFGRGGTPKSVTAVPAGAGASEPAMPAAKPHHVMAASEKVAPVIEKKPAATNSSPSAKAARHFMVQVGAIPDRKEAQRLVAQLHKESIHASIYTHAHEKSVYVLMGPFATETRAQSARQHVHFHAILTHS